MAKDTDENAAAFAMFANLAKSTKQKTSANAPKDSAATSDAKEKPCRVCDSFKSWRLHEAKAHVAKDKSSAKKAAAAATATAATAAAMALGSPSSSTSTLVTGESDECPPDSQVLGRATWTFLHTMAAYYPEKADEKQQQTMNSLLTSFSHFYPCGRCASHLREEMKNHPPAVDSRHALSQWLCQTHNKVNVLLGKPDFDCSKVDERWRDGPSDGRCSWAQDVQY
ncbi:Flavin-linked sulfhydryl oxidase of the mitochondrial IMS [Coemansia sp. RSA 1722]|nr:Flavin-linked sulfhydryl oxidase of the mitochondrial IMS [Coemansia sp. RSA 1722]